MKKIIHYILIGIMLNWNVAVFAETDQGCANWEVVEETDKYIQESCADVGEMQARIRSKPIEGLNIIVVESTEEKKQNPIKKFKDKVEETEKATAKVEKIEKIEKEVIVTENKVKELKKEKDVVGKVEEKVEEVIKGKKLHDIEVADTQKPEVKEEITKVEVDAKADEKLVEQATEQEWADVDAEQKIDWMQFHELLPRLIVENEKIKAAELDYEAAVESLKSEYTAYYPQVTISVGNNWEDDRTPSKGT